MALVKQVVAGSTTTLHKGLKQRHVAMIALGGVIGAGLFVGSGVGDQVCRAWVRPHLTSCLVC